MTVLHLNYFLLISLYLFQNDSMYGPIIFSAHSMNPTKTFSAGEYITGFAEFLINVGDSFTLSDGVFKAPRNGIYEFSASVYNDGGPNVLAVVKNGDKVLLFHDQSNTLSFNWIMDLQKGDHIQLQVDLGSFWCDNFGTLCIFNGKLAKNI